MAKREFEETLIETLKKRTILNYWREKRKKEFLGRLKYGKKYNRTDDPGPW